MNAFDVWLAREHPSIYKHRDGAFVSTYASYKACWEAAKASGGNYTADREVNPRKVTFANGRTVEASAGGHLLISSECNRERGGSNG